MKTTNKLLQSPQTCPSLKRKLQMCGSQTAQGHWHWCRSPACDRCRRYRARIIADGVSDWTMDQTSYRLHKIEIGLPSYSAPKLLLKGIRKMRLQFRGIFDRQQREN